MEELLTPSRRDFLKKMMVATIATATCPHILLGKEEPEIKNDGKKITGVYKLDLRQPGYEVLQKDFGSVRFTVLDKDGKPQTMIVNRLPKKMYGRDFACMNQLCTHQGNKIQDPAGPLGIMRCDPVLGHGSRFYPDGRYLDGPAHRDLPIFICSYTPGDDYVYINIDFYDNPADTSSDSNNTNGTGYSYMRDAFPNPCSNFTDITYAVEKNSSVQINVYDSAGNSISSVVDGLIPSGEYSVRVDTSKFSNGMYFITFTVNSRKVSIQRLLVQR